MPVLRAGEPQIEAVIVRFGAGLNSRASETAIDDAECSDGQNFNLDIENDLFSRRAPFELMGTAPNAEPMNGFAKLVKQDGTISTLAQAGNTVYEWDGSSFTSRGTINSGAKLRGYRTQNFTLSDSVLITDLNEQQPVMTWNGTTLAEMTHNLGGNFFARYCAVDDERAFFTNVRSGSSTPHLIVASERSNFNNLSVSNRPSTSLSESDPFFLLAPDLKPINGIVIAFDTVTISTKLGQLFKLVGSSSKDFAFGKLYPDSAASGDEAIVYIGNDIAYGRNGRVETVFSADSLGDVETDDLSREIAPDVEDVTDWLAAFSSRRQKLYLFDRDRSQVFVFHKAFVDERIRAVIQRRDPAPLSPWAPWKTQHPSGFQTNVCMSLLNPLTGLEDVFFGGPGGEIFRFEGAGGQDGGTTNLTVERTSKSFQLAPGARLTGVRGFIRYRKIFATTVTLSILYGGEVLLDQAVTINLPAAENLPVYAGGLYYNNNVYYSAPFKERFARQPFTVSGSGTEFQVKVAVTGAEDFFIEEVQIMFDTA